MQLEIRPFDQLLIEIQQLDPEYLLKVIHVASETLLATTQFKEQSSLSLSPLKLSDFLRQSPLSEVDLDLTRNQETSRTIEL
jgi:hypothetical protein